MRGIVHRTLVSAAAILVAFAGAAPIAEAQTLIQFDLPAQPLADSLRAVGSQTNINLLFDPPLVAGRDAPALNAQLTADQALSRLLAGTGITHEFLNERTVVLAAAAAGTAGASGEPSNDIAIEEILVTGTHIRGATELPMPSITFTREQIDRTGYSRVEELFKSLPQNLADIGPTVGAGASSIATDNIDRATGVNLRGLGPQSTLVLLNGQRRAGSVQGRAVDISAIPLSLIERVEVVTGGRSAIYGSDAVAGVVNLVTRRDFEGAESRAYYGGASAGAECLQLSQLYGRRFDSGGFVAAYDYSDDRSLDATEAGVVRLPTISGIVPTPGDLYLLPQSTRHSGFASGSYSIGGSAEVYADALYTSDENESITSYSFPGFFDYFERSVAASDQYSVAPGIRSSLGDAWRLDISGVHGKVRSRVAFDTTFGVGESRSEAGLSSISAVLDGSVLSTRRFAFKTAVGAESRWESFESAAFVIDSNRTVRSVFAEALLSWRPEESGRRQLQLSLAGRHSNYDDFGSSFDPQFGVVWIAGGGVSLRGAYSTAFRAPDLYSLNDAIGTAAILIDQTDPTQPGSSVPTLIWQGKNPALEPEEAETWSIGFDYVLPLASAVKVSASYFDIRYNERIDEPATGDDRFVALLNENRYPGLIERSPSAAQLRPILDAALAQGGFGNNTSVPFDPGMQTLLEAFPNLVLFDDRIHNISEETIRGFDLSLDASVGADLGTLSFGLNGTYYLELERRVIVQAPAVIQLNSASKPVDFRLRANAGWTRSAFGAFAYLNYVDDYRDTLATPARRMSSWTTVDTTLRFDGSAVANDGLLHGLVATLGILNLFDREPPVFLSNTFGVAYDPANADALGRFISLSLVKRW